MSRSTQAPVAPGAHSSGRIARSLVTVLLCAACGGALVHRADDNEETITQRLKVYEAQTSPLVSFYEGRSKLRVVPAEGEIDAVYERLLSALGEALPAG